MQKKEPEPTAVMVDEMSEMPAGVTDDQVAALLAKGEAMIKNRKKKPALSGPPAIGPLLAVVHHGEIEVRMHGVVNVDRPPKAPAPFKWHSKKYPQIILGGDNAASGKPDQELGIRKQFGPYTAGRAQIRASTVYHDLKASRRKRIKAQYRARLLMRQTQRMAAA